MPEAFNLCLEMKEGGVKPNIVTYDQLLMMCAKNNATTEAWAIFEDMLCMGIRPQRETFHHLLLVSLLPLDEVTHFLDCYSLGIRFS